MNHLLITTPEITLHGLLGYVKRLHEPIVDDFGNEQAFHTATTDMLRARSYFLYETGHIEALTRLFIV